MSIRKLRAGRVNGVTASTWVGEPGTIFYDEVTGQLKIADGHTPGGHFVNLVVASSTQLGGIKAGPGINIGSDGLLTIDSAGLPVSFGDFYASANNLSTVNANQDVNILSNGTGKVNVVGQYHVHTTAGGLNSQPIFKVTSSGQVRILAPDADTTAGAVEIIGNATGSFFPPNQNGIVLQTTGYDTLVARNYFDGSNNYSLLVGRRYNGTTLSPSKVLNGQMFFRIAGQASNDTGFETFGPCQIDMVATEDQGPNNQGGEVRIRATPNGVNALSGIVQVASFNGNTGVTSFRFNGPLTGNVTGNLTGNVIGNASTVSVITSNQVTTALGYTPANKAGDTFVGIIGATALENTPIGVTTASTGRFTSVSSTGSLTVDGSTTLNGSVTVPVGAGALTIGSSQTSGTITIGGNGFSTSGLITIGRSTGSQTVSIATGAATGGATKTINIGTGSTIGSSTAITIGSTIGTTVTAYGAWAFGSTISANVSGNAGTVTNGVYTTDTGTVTNTMLAGNIANNKLVNSTISGVQLGSSLNALTAGYGLKMSSGTTYDGSTALTINKYDAVTGPVTVTGNAYALDLSAANGVVILDNNNVNFTVTLSNPVPGKLVRLMVVNIKGATTVTVSGLTATNSSNGTNQFVATTGNFSTAIVEFICATSALSGVYMNLSGAK